MTAIEMPLAELCARARPELACLGDAGVPLVSLLTVVERAGTSRPAGVLADPGFALEVLTLAGPDIDPTLIGRVLDYLRARGDRPTAGTIQVAASVPRITDAVATYQAKSLALMDNGTERVWRTWNRRLVAEHGDDDPRYLTAGDLNDLIAGFVVEARRKAGGAKRAGLCSQETAILAYRHMWKYFVQKGWASENVAKLLTKPPRPEPNRRDLKREESVLLRHLAVSTSRDVLLDEVTLAVPERLGTRPCELRRFRLCDFDTEERTLLARGKLDKERLLPVPDLLFELLMVYVEDRRPARMSLEAWLASEETLLRRGPTPRQPLGRPSGRRRIEDLWARLRRLAPEVFARGDVTANSHRHAVASFVDSRYGRGVTRAILGHSSKQTSTDHYVHVAMEDRAEALRAYENWILEAEPGAGNKEVAS